VHGPAAPELESDPELEPLPESEPELEPDDPESEPELEPELESELEVDEPELPESDGPPGLESPDPPELEVAPPSFPADPLLLSDEDEQEASSAMSAGRTRRTVALMANLHVRGYGAASHGIGRRRHCVRIMGRAWQNPSREAFFFGQRAQSMAGPCKALRVCASRAIKIAPRRRSRTPEETR
jgi:hypothetical protein